jgi:hypothetical protein
MTVTEATVSARRDRALLLIGAVATVSLALRAAWYHPFFADDAFISLRYADRVLSGHVLTWSDDQKVECYSNLLWVLACSALGALGGDLVWAARGLGIVATLAALGAILFAHRRRETRLVALGVVLVVVAASNPIAIWSIGGLETPLVLALVSWSIALLRVAHGEAHDKTVSVLLGLLALTRPDGVVLTAGILLATILETPRDRRWPQALRLSLGSVIAVLAQLAFRLAYYGDWVPNTARVKLLWSPQRLVEGALYLRNGALAHAPLVGLLLAALMIRTESVRARTRLFLLPAGLWAAYVGTIGGDIFPGHRHFAPVVLLAGWGGVEVLDQLLRRFEGARTWGLVVAVLAASALLQGMDADGARAKDERWEWDGRTLGLFLKSTFAAEQPTLAVDAAGAVPFYSRLPAIDMVGLNDRWIATHPPDQVGVGFLGHELGDGASVLARHPDFVLLGRPPGEVAFELRSEKQMIETEEFQRDYRALFLEIGDPPLIARLWTRLTSPTIGIRRQGNTVVVPGMFFARGHRTTAVRQADGTLVTVIRAGREARLTNVPLGVGRWTVALNAEGPASIRVAPTGEGFAPDGDGFVLSGATAVDVFVAAGVGDVRLLAVSFAHAQ